MDCWASICWSGTCTTARCFEFWKGSVNRAWACCLLSPCCLFLRHVTNNTCVKRNIFKILPQSDWLFQQLKTTKATEEKLTWLFSWCWFVLADQGAPHLPNILWCSSKSFTWNRRNMWAMPHAIVFSVKQPIKWRLVAAETNSCCTPMSQQQWLSRLKSGAAEPGAH